MQRFDWTGKREINDQVFFVMGFIDGASLAEKLAAGPLAPRDALPILRDVDRDGVSGTAASLGRALTWTDARPRNAKCVCRTWRRDLRRSNARAG